MDVTNRDESRKIATRIQRGDRAAEQELVERYSHPLLHSLLRLTRDQPLSEDLHQETFRIVILRLRRCALEDPEKLLQFILCTGRNLALGQRRKSLRRGEHKDLPEDLPDPAQGQLERMLQREQREILRRLLSHVSPDRYRQVLHRFYVAGEDKVRICSDFGVSERHFNCLLSRARQRLEHLAAGSQLRWADHRTSQRSSQSNSQRNSRCNSRCNSSLAHGRYQVEDVSDE